MKKNGSFSLLRLVKHSFICSILLLLCGQNVMAAASDTPEWKDALKSYNEYLSRDTIFWTGSEGAGAPVSEQMQFMIRDLNSDGIPELIVKNTEYVYGWIEIYTYTGSGVEEVISCDIIAGCYPGTPVFFIRTENDPVYETYFCLNDISDEIIGWQLKIGQTAGYEGGTEYYWYGIYTDETSEDWYNNSATPISQSDFESHMKEIIGETDPVDFSEEEWYDNTDENRKKILTS